MELFPISAAAANAVTVNTGGNAFANSRPIRIAAGTNGGYTNILCNADKKVYLRL